MTQAIVTYAQNREDLIIEGFFPDIKQGFYLDIGANHPLYHSVTKLFYDKGWSGINVEPNPKLFNQITKVRTRDTNLKLAVGSNQSSLKLRVYASRDGLSGISTMSDEMMADYTAHENADTKVFEDINVEVKPLNSILAEVKPKHIHFMKVDVEGFEYEVLEGNDWSKYRPELICIEANHVLKDWGKILNQAKYHQVFNDGLNNYYLAHEALYRKELFDYVKVFLSGGPVINHQTHEELRALRIQVGNLTKLTEQLTSKNSLLEIQIAEQKSMNDKMSDLLSKITPLPKHLKFVVQNRLKKMHNKVTND